MTYVVGFDLSLRAPAACRIPVDWKPGDWGSVQVEHLLPVVGKNASIDQKLRRYITIRDWVAHLVYRHSIWIEGYAFRAMNGSALIELGGVVRVAILEQSGKAPNIIPAAAARKLFFGKRKLPRSDQKTVVQTALFNEMKAPPLWTEDEADAFIIANYGLSQVGGTAAVLE